MGWQAWEAAVMKHIRRIVPEQGDLLNDAHDAMLLEIERLEGIEDKYLRLRTAVRSTMKRLNGVMHELDGAAVS
jgi:hypothetical protein